MMFQTGAQTPLRVGSIMSPGMRSSLKTDWTTPDQLFHFLDREFRFDLDVCAASAMVSKCDLYFSPKDDSLHERCIWRFRCWCNPPYGREIGRWIEKAYRSSIEHGSTVVCLLPARTDTSWWHDYCMRGEIRFLRGRLCFNNDRRGRAPFPSAIVIFRGSGPFAVHPTTQTSELGAVCAPETVPTSIHQGVRNIDELLTLEQAGTKVTSGTAVLVQQEKGG